MLPTINVATGLALLVSVVLPLIVGLVTRMHTHPAVKSALLLALSTITTSVTELIQRLSDANYHFSWSTWGYQLIVTIVVAQLAHTQVWKTTGVTDIVQAAFDPEHRNAVESAASALDESVSRAKPGPAGTPPPATDAVPV